MHKKKIPLFGARKYARDLQGVVEEQAAELKLLRAELDRFGGMDALSVRKKIMQLNTGLKLLQAKHVKVMEGFEQQKTAAQASIASLRQTVAETRELALLQEAGVYEYRHPLTDAVAYQHELKKIQDLVKSFVKEDKAISASTDWTVNNSAVQGRRMVKETSKLMLRAFNAEADSLVRWLKPYKLDVAIDRLRKSAATIERLGKTMNICITWNYLNLRITELELTADYLNKSAEEKQAEKEERERMREERRAQQEMERERTRLEKERQHYTNALEALINKGDEEAAERMREQLRDVDRALEDVDYRAANIRAGYVYVISNIGSFGENMVKIGMTRRLDPMDRVRELGDASVPFNFDVHALFFSKDAVGIEATMHQRLAEKRVNQINLRREFFHVSPAEAKTHLAELAGELLQFQDVPDAIEYRESVRR